MTKPLYLEDSYMKEFTAKVTSVDGCKVELDQSAFYPESGGQPGDQGKIFIGDDEFNVKLARKDKGRTVHEVEKEGLAPCDEVTGEIDWERRYRLMRMHTAAHVLSGIISQETGADITGNQLGIERSRIDFSLQDFDREQLQSYEGEANELIAKELPVNMVTLPREEAFKIPSIVKLRMMLPESVKQIRIVDIEGFDKQACGGTHVKNIKEIGNVSITGAENKGKDNRRIYFTIG
ncbi:MAG: alanyl-tRNA editing protein [Nanoarchaeota archaeon]|nr:alanyl-tRNA editing protein [Nanoarchaeota archaeon]